MKRSLLWRLAIPFILLIILSVGGVSLYAYRFMERTYYENLRNTLRTEADLIARDVINHLREGRISPELNNLVNDYAGITRVRVTIILPDGQVIGESGRDPLQVENHLNRPEVQQALRDGEGSAVRFSDTVRQRLYYLALRIDDNNQPLGVVRLASSIEKIESDLLELRNTILGNAVLAIILTILLAFLVANQTITPLRQLTREVSRLGIGNFNIELPTHRKDEIGILSQAFIRIAKRLGEQIEGYREERSKLDAVLQNMNDAILIVDGQGLVTLINPAAERIFNVDSSRALGHSLVEVVRQHPFVELWRTCVKTKRQQIATIETTPERLFIQGIATPLEPLLPENTLLVFQDLTRVRRLEVVRRDFISNVSHELRTPLASLKALTETLQEGALEDPPAARRFLQKMESEIDNMTQLVRELLELSRIESGKVPFNLKPVQPNDLVSRAVERMQLQAERAGLTLRQECAEGLPNVLADAERIEQVLVNLLHNAIKFTPAGGEIVARTWKEAGQVIFSVQDTGVGIEPAALSRIFERFYKADQSRSGGGTGLGLSIARHTIEAHSGRIWAESEVNRGSTFYFSLPAA
ncbi:ATP-binding protein [Bellilinea sp.]|jgi:two-component system phosphate regulon sensor histidine kinase PhoR|uniref:histidine kinase n=1 Tax=Bellilinea caldifistulae TaxID=360411 RepID=A0A7C4Q3R9_9CHLR|nr:ATP-binding protein [Bellilinea sp.]